MQAATEGSLDWNAESRAVRELCAKYDPLLCGEVVPNARDGQLTTLARVFDVDPQDMSDAETWRRVRPLLTSEFANALVLSDEAATKSLRVFLPGGVAMHRHRAGAVSPTQEKLLILVVEDDSDVASALVEILTEDGHSVVGPAARSRDASCLAGLHAIDLALIDVGLAESGDGIALGRQINRDWGTPVLFLSADQDNERVLQEDASIGFIGKPFKAVELLDTIALAAALIRKAAG